VQALCDHPVLGAKGGLDEKYCQGVTDVQLLRRSKSGGRGLGNAFHIVSVERTTRVKCGQEGFGHLQADR